MQYVHTILHTYTHCPLSKSDTDQEMTPHNNCTGGLTVQATLLQMESNSWTDEVQACKNYIEKHDCGRSIGRTAEHSLLYLVWSTVVVVMHVHTSYEYCDCTGVAPLHFIFQLIRPQFVRGSCLGVQIFCSLQHQLL
jgi:hypothetical protein